MGCEKSIKQNVQGLENWSLSFVSRGFQSLPQGSKTYCSFLWKNNLNNIKKLLRCCFLHNLGCCGRSPLQLERGKIRDMQTGTFSMCSDFWWDLATKSPTKPCMSPRNLRKTQGEEGSCLLLKKRRAVLPESICSTRQNCLPLVLCLLGRSKRSVTA